MPSRLHTSDERFSIASVLKPICRLLSMAARLAGPVIITRQSFCTASTRPGRRITSANRPSVGKYNTAKSVVCGGDTYLAKIFFASSLMEVSNALPADRMAALSAASCASMSRWYCSTGYLESMGNHTGCSSFLPGRRIANSTSSSLPGTVLTLRANWSGVSTLSMMAPSCISPQVPRDFTLVITRLRSPTLPARVCISPRPLCTCSSRSDTSLKDSPRRCSSVACSFSSTVRRISSSLVALSA